MIMHHKKILSSKVFKNDQSVPIRKVCRRDKRILLLILRFKLICAILVCFFMINFLNCFTTFSQLL